MVTVITLSHKYQNPVTENDNHTMAMVITTHIFITSHKAQSPLTTANDNQPILLLMQTVS
jgi:hypothetical protein